MMAKKANLPKRRLNAHAEFLACAPACAPALLPLPVIQSTTAPGGQGREKEARRHNTQQQQQKDGWKEGRWTKRPRAQTDMKNTPASAPTVAIEHALLWGFAVCCVPARSGKTRAHVPAPCGRARAHEQLIHIFLPSAPSPRCGVFAQKPLHTLRRRYRKKSQRKQQSTEEGGESERESNAHACMHTFMSGLNHQALLPPSHATLRTAVRPPVHRTSDPCERTSVE